MEPLDDRFGGGDVINHARIQLIDPAALGIFEVLPVIE